jgi:hypothetical protein
VVIDVPEQLVINEEICCPGAIHITKVIGSFFKCLAVLQIVSLWVFRYYSFKIVSSLGCFNIFRLRLLGPWQEGGTIAYN